MAQINNINKINSPNGIMGKNLHPKAPKGQLISKAIFHEFPYYSKNQRNLFALVSKIGQTKKNIEK